MATLTSRQPHYRGRLPRGGVAGDVDVSNASALRDVLTRARLEAPGKGSFAIDLAEVPHIDSTGMVSAGAAH